MKLNRATAAASFLALAVTATACDQGLTDINRNPNVPEDVPAVLLLRPAIYQSAASGLGVNINLNHAGLWAQHVAQIQYGDEDRYVARMDRIQATWDAAYALQLADLQTMINKGREGGDVNAPNAVGIGLILKSWNFGWMTDMWGDIPYSEALRGEEGIFTPKYDTQQEIYNGLFADLREAHQVITTGGFGAADLLYGGDMAKWRRFANSLRMRYAMNLTKADPAKARAEFEAAIATGAYFMSAADEARLNWLTASPNQNPLHVNDLTRSGDHRVSHTLVEWLKERNDPRLRVYAQPTADDTSLVVGYRNGQPNNSATLNSRSRIGTTFLAANAPAYFMSYSEVLFLRAEAAHRGWNAGGGTAESLYYEAITANLKRHGVSDAAVATYLARPEVMWNAANALQLIAEQKWASFYMQGVMAWNEWRRTGFPAITPGPAANGAVPRRQIYPDLELSLNHQSLQAAISRQGNVDLQGRLWWDK